VVAPPKIVALPDGIEAEVGGNRLRYIVDCDTRIEQYVALLDGAQTSIEIISYILEEDAAGTRIRAALIAAAARGVQVRMVVDSFGSGETSAEFFAPLAAAGVEHVFFSRRWRSSYLIRNHQKMLIIDGETLFFGGFNLSDCYFDGCGVKGWTDLGLMLTGPAAAPMVDWFARLFAFTRAHDGNWLKLRRMIKEWQAAHPAHGRFQWLVGGPTQRLSPWARAIRSDLTLAERVDMVMAYFSPGQGMLRRLGRIARRGQVRLITAARSDNGATIGAARLLYGYLLRRGVAVREYQPQRLHMKLVVADDAAYVGSANFDMRSLFVNLEVMLRVEDAAFAAQLRKLVDAMEAESENISRDWLRVHGGIVNRIRWFLSWFVVSTVDYTVVRRLNFGLEVDPEAPGLAMESPEGR
jgi:cardiolipin synthase